MSGAWHFAGQASPEPHTGRVTVPPGLRLERWPIPLCTSTSHVIAVALRPDLLAVVEASQPTKIWVQRLPKEGSRDFGEGFTLVAPGAVRVLRFSQDTVESKSVYLAAATSRECFIFQALPGSEALLLDLEVLPPHLPCLSFDESGSLLAVAGAGLANIPIVQSLEGTLFTTAMLPSVDESHPLVVCCFLRSSFAYVLAVVSPVN